MIFRAVKTKKGSDCRHGPINSIPICETSINSFFRQLEYTRQYYISEKCRCEVEIVISEK